MSKESVSESSVDSAANVLAAQQTGDPERLAEALLDHVERTEDPTRRRESLLELARVFEEKLADPARALPVYVAAVALDPTDLATVDLAIGLAIATGDLDDLVRELSEAARQTGEPALWLRLGNLYARERTLADYADAAYRQVLRRQPDHLDALTALCELCRKTDRLSDLATWLEARIPLLADPGERAGEFLALGDLYESQLAAPAKAEAAFEKATASGEVVEDALTALARLYNQKEQWTKLAAVLDRQATLQLQHKNPRAAAATYRRAASLRDEKLGDTPAAIARLEAAIAAAPDELSHLEALVAITERNHDSEKYYASLELLARKASDKDRLPLLRRLAVELEADPTRRERAIATFYELLAADPNGEEHYRGLARLLRGTDRQGELLELLESQARIATGKGASALWSEIAELRNRNNDAQGAYDAYETAAASAELDPATLPIYGKLAEQLGRVDRARDAWARYGELAGNAAALRRAADLSLARLGQIAEAENLLQKSLAYELDAAAYTSLAEVCRRRAAWSDAIGALTEAARLTDSPSQRVLHLTAAAELADGELNDKERGTDLWLRVIAEDATQTAARARAASYLASQGRWKDALPHFSRLSEFLPDVGEERARLELEWGQGLVAELDVRGAASHFQRSADADPKQSLAWLEWTGALQTLAEDSSKRQDWEELADASGLALSNLGNRIQPAETAVFLGRRARAERALGEYEAALASVDAAAAVVGQTREIKDLRGQLIIELADTQAQAAPERATELYRVALGAEESSLPLLHKLLEVETRQGRWSDAVETLEKIASLTESPERRAKVANVIAAIYRDELGDKKRAAQAFLTAAALDPSDPNVVENAETVLRDTGAFSELANLYRAALRKQEGQANPARELELWTKLGDLSLTELDQPEAAMFAYEVVTSLDPTDLERREELMELYLEEGDSRRGDALEELQALAAHQPERIEIYRMLADLHRAEGNRDGEWTACQALSLLGVTEADDEATLQAGRPAGLRPGRSRLSPEQWQKELPHANEERRLAAVLARAMVHLAPAVAQPISAYGIEKAARVDLSNDHRAPARVVQYAVDLLGMEPAPAVYLDEEEAGGVRIASLLENNHLVPALLIGLPFSLEQDERILAFEIGRALSYLRPERLGLAAFHTLPALKTAIESIAGNGKWTPALQKGLGSDGIAELRELLGNESGDELLGRVANFRDAADHTANRAGLLLCGDLEVAASALTRQNGALTTLPVRDRLRELLAFSVSETYLALRRHTGLSLEGTAGAGVTAQATPE